MPDRAKPIPIYDETAPIACTIADREIPERVALVERMRTRLRSIDRTPTGLLLHFSDDDAARADLAKFAVDEKRCCQFWGFDIQNETDGVSLGWDGPPAVTELLDALEHFFTSDEPVSALNGLLGL